MSATVIDKDGRLVTDLTKGDFEVVDYGVPRDITVFRNDTVPFAVTIPVQPGERQRAIAAIMPFVGAMQTGAGAATAFVCRDFACREPVSTADALASQLTPQG